MNDIFTRVDSTETLPQVLKRVSESFELGDITKSVPILTGYQDCNIDLTTTNGRFVVKLFSSEKSKERIDDVITGYVSWKKAGIPVPTIRTTSDGAHLMEIPGKSHPSYVCVFDYFEGKPLTRVPLTDEDVRSLTEMLATIHRIKNHKPHYYDTLGIINLPSEYKAKHTALSQEEQTEIAPVVAKFQRLNLSAFRQSVLHGTMEKENVLKNTNGDLCLLDLGCMDYNASILDIAAFIANFTLYLDATKRHQIIERILTTYQQSHPLTHEEIAALPTLIRAQYAAYIIGMTYHMRIEHDMTKQTQTWLDRGWDGLHAYHNVKSLT